MSDLKKQFSREVSFHEQYNCYSDIDYLIVVVQRPDGAKELIVNSENIEEKIKYYNDFYDENFALRNNSQIKIVGYLIA